MRWGERDKRKRLVRVGMRIKSRFAFGFTAALLVIHLVTFNSKFWLLLSSEEPSSKYSSSMLMMKTTAAAAAAKTTTTTSATPSSSLFPPYPLRRDQITRSRNVILLGPQDRYNFGDLLFTKVLVRLLQTRAYYVPEEILFAGIIDANMTKYGGEETIRSIGSIQKLSIQDKSKGPYDIIYTGGESLGCDFNSAVMGLPNEKDREWASRRENKVHDCPYLIPKHLLAPPKERERPSNIAILNSVGGIPTRACKEAVQSSDFVAYRDRDNNLYPPDSAVMTRELFQDEIDGAAKGVLQELELLFQQHKSSNGKVQKYVAVQHKEPYFPENTFLTNLAKSLDEVSKESGSTIIFFAAGTAPWHDSFDMYEEVAALMTQPNIIYRTEHVWEVVALISRSQAVLSTSLHVRIMAFLYWKPRVTWCTETKHERFIQLWDAKDSTDCVRTVNETWSILKNYVGPDPAITQERTRLKYRKAVEKYIASFDQWSSKLLRSMKKQKTRQHYNATRRQHKS